MSADEADDVLPDVAETRAQFSVVSAGLDLSPAAGGKYYQYARVPHKKSWEFGKMFHIFKKCHV